MSVFDDIWAAMPWQDEGVITPYPTANDPEIERVEAAKARIKAIEAMALGEIPSAGEYAEMQRPGIAGQASQAHQNLVSNAAQRGLIHSGIMRAGQQKITEQAMGQWQAATAQAQNMPRLARAKLLTSLATGKPLPEVTFETQPSGAIPMMLGIAGGIVGAYVGGGPAGASAGYAVGSGAGQIVQGGPTYHTAGRPTSSFG